MIESGCDQREIKPTKQSMGSGWLFLRLLLWYESELAVPESKAI